MKRLLVSLVVLVSVCAASANTIMGDSVVITDNGTRKTFQGQHLRVVINADDCAITLRGHVDALSVGGTKNQVLVNARTDAVALLGSHNKVVWSKKANTSSPPVSDNGQGNSITAGP